MALRLEDYALIGDRHTAALVGRDGSIDWLCLPRFDSGACCAALLGTTEHGRWLLAPSGQARSRRCYREDTLVLETEHETADGVVVVTDCMPSRDQGIHLVRLVEGKRGTVPMHLDLVIRFDYGSIVPWVQRTEGGISAIGGPDRLLLHTPVELYGKDLHTYSEFTVEAGQQIPFDLTWHPSHEPAPQPIDPVQAIAETVDWWQQWSARCNYHGPWRDAVVRSLITLKALNYEPTGGIVAAATTSLPEKIGGVRNWDYRFCWVRDATFTLLALINAGYLDEARAWRNWLLRAAAGQPSDTRIMYGLAGERRLPELELDWLPGYENSRPVRIGNAASQQFQLDIYGEMIDALYLARTHGLEPLADTWHVALALLSFVEEAYKKPDEGIWEVRGPRRHFTHSKVMAWLALDRGIKAIENLGREGPLERWRQVRDTIHDEVCREAFNPTLGSFVQYYGAKNELDASLLMIPLVGFLPASDPRMAGTIQAIGKHLMRDGFVQRYTQRQEVDGLPPGEGAFLACTFWYADNLYLLSRQDEAREVFERLLGLCNDVGLLSEEYDPQAKRLLGNFPQAFSHVGLVNTAMNLSPRPGPADQRPRGDHHATP